MEQKTKVPKLVRAIAILNYIGASVGPLAIGALFFIGGEISIIAGMFAIPILIFSALSFSIGRGLYRAKNWARILSIILGIGSLFWGIALISRDGLSVSMSINTVLNLLITGYLLFNKEVKAVFAKKETEILPQDSSSVN